ncbi:MAG: DUF4190 domain-containing protein [Rhodococcus sp. (in: high G+C Gram-positive bacteria)]
MASSAILAAGIALGVVVAIVTNTEGYLPQLPSVLSFIVFAWMQNATDGRKVAATVLAILTFPPSPFILLTGGMITAAWILVRRRSLVPLVLSPFAAAGTLVVPALAYDHYPDHAAALGFVITLAVLAVFAWLAVGIDALITSPHAPPVPTTHGYATQSPVFAASSSTKTNRAAIFSLLSGLVCIAPFAIALGHLARSQIHDTGDRGAALAAAGLILGYMEAAAYVAFPVIGFLQSSNL